MSDAEVRRSRGWLTPARVVAGFLVVILFAFSLWSSMWQPSTVAMLAWVLGWIIVSGRVALHWPSLEWPVLCALAMLLVWLPWTLHCGQTAWQST